MSAATVGSQSEAEVFGRLLSNGRGKMSAALARYVLRLGFAPEEQGRMQELAERNQGGALSADESAELRAYVIAGHLLALLHARARQTLRKGA